MSAYGAHSSGPRQPARLRARTGDPRGHQAGQQRGHAAPAAAVLAAIAEAAAGANRYPDLSVTGLTTRLAGEFDLDPARIAVGCGSVSLCQQLVAITCREPGDEVVYAWRSFESYPIVTQIQGRREAARAAGRSVPPRPRGHGRRRHRADPARLRLHPEQPHRDGRGSRRVRALPADGRPGRARRARRGLPRVRDRSRRRRRHRSARHVPEPRRAAHLLQGLPARRPPGGLRAGGAGGGAGAAEGAARRSP